MLTFSQISTFIKPRNVQDRDLKSGEHSNDPDQKLSRGLDQSLGQMCFSSTPNKSFHEYLVISKKSMKIYLSKKYFIITYNLKINLKMLSIAISRFEIGLVICIQ